MKKIALIVVCFVTIFSFGQTVDYVKVFGSTGNENITRSAFTPEGDIISIGYFVNTVDFDPGGGTSALSPIGIANQFDLFIQKLDANGNFDWVKQIGNDAFQVPLDLAIDDSGNIYLLGSVSSGFGNVDVDPGAGIFTIDPSSGTYFCLKLDSNGDFVWAFNTDFEMNRIDVSGSGEIYVTGSYQGMIDFDPGAGTVSKTATGIHDFAIVKYNTSGDFQWVHTIGGTDLDVGRAIRLNNTQDKLWVGMTSRSSNLTEFPIELNSSLLANQGMDDAVLFCLDLTSNQFEFGYSYGSTGTEQMADIIVDQNNNAYATGRLTNTVDFDHTAGTLQLTGTSSGDAFLVKVNSDYSFGWAKQITGVSSGTNNRIGVCLGIDPLDNIYLGGYFNGTTYFNSGNVTSDGGSDYYIQKYNSNGSELWSRTYGGSGEENIRAIQVSDNFDIIASGSFEGTVDFNGGAIPTMNRSSNGGTDCFIQKIQQCSPTTSVDNHTACGFFTWQDGITYTASNNSAIYIVENGASNGCDSVVTLNLTIFDPNDPTTIDLNLCKGSSYTFPDGTIIENIQDNMTYTATLTNQLGCDSLVITSVNILDLATINYDVTNASCNESNGSIDLTVGGLAPFEFAWNNGSDDEDLEDLNANTYVVTVIDANDCEVSEIIHVLSNELVIDASITNNVCRNLTAGAVDLTITGASPFEFEWTNGAETEDISNLGAGVYEVIVTDANDCQSSASFEVGEPDAFEFESVVSLASCGTSNGAIDLTVSGGNGSYDFDWVDASNTNVGNTEDLSSIPQGLYTVTVTDANGCTGSYQTNVSENGAPEIILDSFYVASCLDDGALFTSINSPNTIQSITWSNAETSDDITNLAEGSYSVSVEDNLGCVGTAIFEVPSAIPSATQICLVTVDQNTNTNLVVWEKPVSTDISSFVIYRESSVGGTFQALDTVLYSELSEYTDPNAFPHIRSWKYRIGTINTCGVESQLSSIHKTVHCAINAGLNGVYNIYWDNYSGFNYTTFEVWRHTTSNGWEEIESLAVGNNSYTDTPPETNGLDYYVAVSAPSLCSSSKANDYNTSRSNRTAGVFEPIDSTINVLDYESLNIQISPNPFNETLFIEGLENQTVKLFDIQGKLVKTAKLIGNQVKGLGGLEHGVYLLEVMTSDKRIVRMKLVKQ